MEELDCFGLNRTNGIFVCGSIERFAIINCVLHLEVVTIWHTNGGKMENFQSFFLVVWGQFWENRQFSRWSLSFIIFDGAVAQTNIKLKLKRETYLLIQAICLTLNFMDCA